MSISLIRLTLIVVSASTLCSGLDLRALPEFYRPDPFGGIVEADRPAASPWSNVIRFRAARNSFASAHVVAGVSPLSEYSLDVTSPFPVDVYREWFHFNKPDQHYYPDALIPVKLPYRSQIPNPDHAIAKQTVEAFWIDLWIPAGAKPGTYTGKATLTAGNETKSLPIELTVLAATVPQEDAVTLDHNSYGTAWMFDQYPKTLSRSDEDGLFRLIHAYHRTFYEHRGTYHQLGYGHAGKVGPEFAPELAGSGKAKRIIGWDRFDRHYGPLLDGSAFANTRRGPKPIPFVYLPVNPEWPASFLWWGEPGYEAEFVNVLSAMERHFREKNWTSTRFEVFFNHKKRYKGFNWDGDEVRFARDNEYLVTYRRMLDKAVPRDTPVKFVVRADTSWSMADQFEKLRGIVNFWVAGEGVLSWYPEAARKLQERGDIIWSYGGTPPVEHVSSEITLNPLRSWITGVQGFVRWQTVAPGPDPWEGLQGGGETLVYPGDRFGLPEPLASVRLKLQRNCLQDLALLQARTKIDSRETVLSQVVRRYNGTSLRDWRNTPPPLAAKPVLEWNNVNIDEALAPFNERFSKLLPGAWLRVREYALTEPKHSAGGESAQ
jgi:hypothetical protein